MLRTLMLGCFDVINVSLVHFRQLLFYFILFFYTNLFLLFKNYRTNHSALNSCTGGVSRAMGMVLHYKPPASQDSQQLRMEAADDKKSASSWLIAMHKVGVFSCLDQEGSPEMEKCV